MGIWVSTHFFTRKNVINIAAGKALDVVDYLLNIVPPSLLAVKNTNAESTALHWAALNAHMDIVKKLVEHPGGPGVELIDIKNKNGLSPLGEAEMAGWDEGASWLVGKMNLDKVEESSTEVEDEPIGNDQAIEVQIEDADGGVAKMTLKP
jgi:ankyrin repeat protein